MLGSLGIWQTLIIKNNPLRNLYKIKTHTWDSRTLTKRHTPTPNTHTTHTYSVMVDNSDILHECWTACVGSLKHFWAQLLHGTKTTHNTTKTMSLGTQTRGLTLAHVFTVCHTHLDPSSRWEWHYQQGFKVHSPAGADWERCHRRPVNRFYTWFWRDLTWSCTVISNIELL